MEEKEEFENDIGGWDWFAELENRVPAISAAKLMAQPIEPREFLVREILTHGLSILGGAPKCGKSWFVLDLCVHVATGVWERSRMKSRTISSSPQKKMGLVP